MQEPATKSDLQTTVGQLEQRLNARIAKLEARQSADRMDKSLREFTINFGVLLASGVIILWALK
jgi:hypothetical protein